MLSEMPEVTELHPVPDAHVPVMRFKFGEVSIDLLYAKLSLWVIPEVSVGFMLKMLCPNMTLSRFLLLYFICVINNGCILWSHLREYPHLG